MFEEKHINEQAFRDLFTLVGPVYGYGLPQVALVRIQAILDFYDRYAHIGNPDNITDVANYFKSCAPIDADCAPSLQLKFWSNDIQPFFERIKRNRPNIYHLIMNKTSMHVIPKWSTKTPACDRELEFRYSFSAIELILAQQRQKVLPSYFIKTTVLWMCETMDLSSDTEEILAQKWLQYAIDLLEKQDCSHPIIPNVKILGPYSADSIRTAREILLKVNINEIHEIEMFSATDQEFYRNKYHENIANFLSQLKANDIICALRDYQQLQRQWISLDSSQIIIDNDEIDMNETLTILNTLRGLDEDYENWGGCGINETNITTFKRLFFQKPLIDELANCLHEIITYGKYLNDPLHLRSVSSLLIALKKIRKYHLTTIEYSLITPILFAATECLCSSYAVDMIKSLERNFVQKLDEVQMLFLHAIPFYLKWYWENCDPENFIKILRMLLNEYTVWFTSCQPDSYVQRSSEIDSMIRNLNYILIRPTEFDSLNIFSEEFYHDYCKLVWHWSSILSSILACSSCITNVKSAARTSVQTFYNFTLHSNVLNFMKTIPSLISMLLKVTDLDHDEMQLNAYRCLGKIMIEADIKTMTKPSKIAAVHIEFLKDTINDWKQSERFYSLLESLKSFVQHDQVKIELIKQEVLPLLVTCFLENPSESIKVQLVALEILFALSFHELACSFLKQNENFMNRIRIFSSKTYSNQLRLQRAAEGLLWKLEKEGEAVAKPTTLTSYKYDVMISYSHKDKEICLRIHQQLINDGFHVWLDKDCLRGPTMVGIANAIENSLYVMICMSNTYKQSVYCQSEAHYAFERGCRLIPIIVESNYKPDGWLGIIVSGKIYVDFIVDEFNLAYEKLKNEISEQRCQTLIQLQRTSEENNQINRTSMIPEHAVLDSESIM
ncbi:unnamed protein product [Rotaria sp. Silwood1]|nr:unnamed protein product [Rotaria sp. Silwood1]CAF1536865.1 unnamed protein product [Rotaria sp. Silwood1]CAF3639536.1 unnamed protein product [Rotaria sp. Silwood1]CAF4695092.1 unnamed protein product [Rotaria sp. Silwood1]